MAILEARYYYFSNFEKIQIKAPFLPIVANEHMKRKTNIEKETNEE
jgi:hypothetical protein